MSLDDILSNHCIQPIGITVLESSPDTAYFYFVHRTRDCGSSFVIPSDDFAHLVADVAPEATLMGTAACEGHCASIEDTAVCRQACRNVPFRNFLRKLLKAREIAVQPTLK